MDFQIGEMSLRPSPPLPLALLTGPRIAFRAAAEQGAYLFLGMGFVANLCVEWERALIPFCYGAKANWAKGQSPGFFNWPLWIMFATSIPSSVAEADVKDLNSSIGGDQRRVPGDPTIERRVVYQHATLLEDLYQTPVRHRVADLKEDREEDDLLLELSALE